MLVFRLLGGRADACGACEVQMMADGIDQKPCVAQTERAKLAPARRRSCKQRVNVLFGFRNCPAARGGEALDAQLCIFVRKAQKRAGVTLGQAVLLKPLKHGGRQAQQAELVGDGGLAFAEMEGTSLRPARRAARRRRSPAISSQPEGVRRTESGCKMP